MSNDRSYFSIVLPTFNRAKFLIKAIESVISQTFIDWELLIIDDGSTDNTRDIVNRYIDSRIRYFFQQNAERSAARNNGIANAKGTYICFLDSDDYFLPDHLSSFIKRITEASEPKALFVSGVIEESKTGRKKKRLFDDSYIDCPLLYYWENTVLTPISVCIHSEILNNDRFIPEYTIWEDTHLWIRILTQYPLYYIDNYTAVNVKHDESGVVKDLAVVKIDKVKKYIAAINHLFNHYPFVLRYINLKMKRMYIDSKYNMFIYQARINGQYRTALNLIIMALKNNFSIRNILLLIKLPLHFIIKGK